jgi:hypothetical protein
MTNGHSDFGQLSSDLRRAEDIRAPEDVTAIQTHHIEYKSITDISTTESGCVVRDLLGEARMKYISFQAVRDGNGYVRSSFVSGGDLEAGRPSVRGMLVAGVLLALTATFIGLMLLGR